jgi:hypothetical protein
MSTILVLTATFGGVAGSIAWLDVLYYLSYLKLAISFIKLLPQVSSNQDFHVVGDMVLTQGPAGLDELQEKEHNRLVYR